MDNQRNIVPYLTVISSSMIMMTCLYYFKVKQEMKALERRENENLNDSNKGDKKERNGSHVFSPPAGSDSTGLKKPWSRIQGPVEFGEVDPMKRYLLSILFNHFRYYIIFNFKKD